MKQIDKFIMQKIDQKNFNDNIGHTNTTIPCDDTSRYDKQDINDIGILNVKKKNTKRLSDKAQQEISSLFFQNEKDQAMFKKYVRKKQIKKQKNHYKYQKIWKFTDEQKPSQAVYHLSEKNVLKLNMDFQSDSEQNFSQYQLPEPSLNISFIQKKHISKNFSLQNYCISLKSLLEQNKFKRIHKVFKCHLCNSYYQQQSLQEHIRQHDQQNTNDNQSIQNYRNLIQMYQQYHNQN